MPANTSSPGALSTGSDSPVTGAWLTALVARDDVAVERNLLAGLDDDDRARRDAIRPATRRSPAASRTSASAGVRSISARIAVRARSSVRASSVCASANRKTTAAASDHWPSTIAPAAAIEHQHVDVERPQPERAARPCAPSAARRRRSTRRTARVDATARRAERSASEHQRRATSADAASSDQSACAPPRSPVGDRLLVLEPGAHAGVGDRAAIADVDSFAASYLTCSRWPIRSAEKSSRPAQVLEPPLEHRDFLAAVHALDLEGRLGVQLADGAGGRESAARSSAIRRLTDRVTVARRRALLHVLEPLLEQPDDVLVVEGVEHHLAGAARPHERACPRSSRSWCETADSLRPRSSAMSPTQSSRARERVEDAHAGGVAEDLEGLGERRRPTLVRSSSAFDCLNI